MSSRFEPLGGKAAEDWEHLVSFYTSPGFTDEEVHVHIDEVRDSKTLIELRRRGA